MITILVWYVGITLLLAAVLAVVSLVQWSVTTWSSRLGAKPVQPPPNAGPARPTRPLVSGGAPRG